MSQVKVFYMIFIKTWHPYLWIIISSLLLYGHVIFFSEYTYYDDDFLIKDNFSKIDEFSDIGRQFLEDVAHQEHGGNVYRPLINVSFILSAQISGLELWGHYLVNVLLHTSSCLLLFVLLLNLGGSRVNSFILSFIFTIHPALTQSIAWIAGRNDSLLAIFILLCFISFLKFISSSSYKWYFYHLLFFSFALFTKETAIVFPLVLLFYVFVVHKDKVNINQIIGLIVVWVVVTMNWYIIRDAARIAHFTSSLIVIKNLLSDLWIAFFYLGKIFWPVNLSFGPIKADVDISHGIYSLIILIGAIFLSTNRNWKIAIFGFLWFGLCLIPTFVYHPKEVLHVTYYEHRIYVPMIGIVILLSSLAYARKIDHLRSLSPIILGIIIFFFCWKSYHQTFHFQNYLTLRQYAAESSPHDKWVYSEIERMSLPLSLQQQIQNYNIPFDAPAVDTVNSTKNCRRTRDILETLKKRNKQELSNKEIIHSLAIVNYARGFLIRAEELFLSAKSLNPQNAEIPYNLGILYYDARRFKQSELEWLQSSNLNPSFGYAYLNLTYLYYEQGEFVKAWDNCQLALRQGVEVPNGLMNEIKSKLNM